MNVDEIDNLITQIEALRIVITTAQREVTQIRDRIANNENNQQNAQAEVEAQEEEDDGSLRIGDRVEILNAVRLRGSLRSSRGVRGSIVRFTGTYVIIRVASNSSNGVETYQDIRRAPHNIARI